MSATDAHRQLDRDLVPRVGRVDADLRTTAGDLSVMVIGELNELHRARPFLKRLLRIEPCDFQRAGHARRVVHRRLKIAVRVGHDDDLLVGHAWQGGHGVLGRDVF